VPPYGRLHDLLSWTKLHREPSVHAHAAGLNYLHCLSPPIVHRDIKSANMLVSAEMHVKVTLGGRRTSSQPPNKMVFTTGLRLWDQPS